MATTFTLSRPELFGYVAHDLGVDPAPEVPEDDVAGTTVEVYLSSAVRPPTGPPVGAPVTSAEVDEDGALAFTGLADDTQYVAYAQVGGVERYVRFRTDPA